MASTDQAAFGIIGGSGLYAMAGLDEVRELRIETPFGPPSDVVRIGRIALFRTLMPVCHPPTAGTDAILPV